MIWDRKKEKFYYESINIKQKLSDYENLRLGFYLDIHIFSIGNMHKNF